MNLNLDAIGKLLGYNQIPPMTVEEMIKSLTITTYPHETTDTELIKFMSSVIKVLKTAGVEFIPIEKAFTKSRGKQKIKKGIVVLTCGDHSIGNLPIDHISSSTDNPIVSILRAPETMSKSNSRFIK